MVATQSSSPIDEADVFAAQLGIVALMVRIVLGGIVRRRSRPNLVAEKISTMIGFPIVILASQNRLQETAPSVRILSISADWRIG
jgi:hypothetical protein